MTSEIHRLMDVNSTYESDQFEKVVRRGPL